MTSTGTVTQAAQVRGTYDPSRLNFFCRDCGTLVTAPAGATGVAACPTRGCRRPTGFGSLGTISRRAQREDSGSPARS